MLVGVHVRPSNYPRNEREDFSNFSKQVRYSWSRYWSMDTVLLFTGVFIGFSIPDWFLQYPWSIDRPMAKVSAKYWLIVWLQKYPLVHWLIDGYGIPGLTDWSMATVSLEYWLIDGYGIAGVLIDWFLQYARSIDLLMAAASQDLFMASTVSLKYGFVGDNLRTAEQLGPRLVHAAAQRQLCRWDYWLMTYPSVPVKIDL